MNDNTLHTLLSRHRFRPALRDADLFWRDCRTQAEQAAREPTTHAGGPERRPRPALRLYPTLASLAAAAAILVAIVSLQAPQEPIRSIQHFQLGDSLAHHGAILMTDSATDATILWVMTDEEEGGA